MREIAHNTKKLILNITRTKYTRMKGETALKGLIEYAEHLRANAQTVTHGMRSTTDADPLSQYGRGQALLDCPLCENRGYLMSVDADGILRGRPCNCMERRNTLWSLRRDGLTDTVKRCTFESYKTDTETQRKVKDAALAFTEDSSGAWFFISGRSGSGKSHICTAAFAALIEGGSGGRFLRWEQGVTRLKQLRYNSPEDYDAALRPLLHTAILYVDDLFVGAASDADLRLAYTILDARYSNARLRTIISCERSLRKIAELPEGERIAGRIAERAKGYILQSPDVNMRLS